jgi:gamma-glutamylcyclotransferase (GGCT)/AIG2-like uncharacterized protein YtfP
MRLFLYGTLLDAGTLAFRGGQPALASRSMPATLPGWRRVTMPGGRYPTLRRGRANCVRGVVIDVAAPNLTRLAAYEGPAYRLRRVVVQTANGKTAAHIWIAPAGTRRPWKE